ncbi:hypothetical protein Tco_0315660 [Tanacetum coccineum]
MAWNLHPFYFEKLDEVLKIHWSVQPKMLFFALHLNHDTAESARVCWNIWHAIRCVVLSSLTLSAARGNYTHSFQVFGGRPFIFSVVDLYGLESSSFLF